jgi:hypothetical protein
MNSLPPRARVAKLFIETGKLRLSQRSKGSGWRNSSNT